MRPVLVYTASRIGLFAVAFGVLYLLGLRGMMWLLIASAVLSGLASYVLLSKQRDAISIRISEAGTSRRGHDTPDQDESYRYRQVDRPDELGTP